MERTGYPVEIAIGLLIMAAFLYLYGKVPSSLETTTATAPAAIVLPK